MQANAAGSCGCAMRTRGGEVVDISLWGGGGRRGRVHLQMARDDAGRMALVIRSETEKLPALPF